MYYCASNNFKLVWVNVDNFYDTTITKCLFEYTTLVLKYWDNFLNIAQGLHFFLIGLRKLDCLSLSWSALLCLRLALVVCLARNQKFIRCQCITCHQFESVTFFWIICSSDFRLVSQLLEWCCGIKLIAFSVYHKAITQLLQMKYENFIWSDNVIALF